jgi:hypothetical protein
MQGGTEGDGHVVDAREFSSLPYTLYICLLLLLCDVFQRKYMFSVCLLNCTQLINLV